MAALPTCALRPDDQHATVRFVLTGASLLAASGQERSLASANLRRPKLSGQSHRMDHAICRLGRSPTLITAHRLCKNTAYDRPPTTLLTPLLPALIRLSVARADLRTRVAFAIYH